MSDDPIVFPPNALGQDFITSGLGGGGGGGGSNIYSLSPSGNQVVLTPTPSGTITQVNVENLPVVLTLTNKTQNISYLNASTIVSNNLAVPGNLILDNNTLTTSGAGSNATISINGNPIGGGSVNQWANYPAIAPVVINNPNTLQVNPNNSNAGFPLYTYPTSVINQNLQVGQPSIVPNNAPNISFYPTDFIVGDDTLLGTAPARSINLYSGAGGTTIRSLQGVGIRAGIDANITATGNINLLAATITLEGAVNITGVQNTIGNTSVEGAFEVIGITTLNGETIIDGQTNITGETNITGLTTINGGIIASGVADLNGGIAVLGGASINGATSITGVETLTGNLVQNSGNIQTSNITDNGGEQTLLINPTIALALENLSSINGSPYVPGTNTPWYSVPAGSDVNLSGYNLTNASGISASLVPDSNLLFIAPLGNITIAAPAGVNITGSAGVNINADLGLNVNTTLNVLGNLSIQSSTITGVSTINGEPYGGSASGWSAYPATQAVSFSGYNLNGVQNINANIGTNLNIVNALTATYIQGNSLLQLTSANDINLNAGVVSGTIKANRPISVSTIVNVSSINGIAYPPPSSVPWYSVPAGSDVNMVNFDFNNVGNIKGQNGGDIFITNQGAGASINVSSQDVFVSADLGSGTTTMVGSIAVVGGRTSASVYSDNTITLDAPTTLTTGIVQLPLNSYYIPTGGRGIQLTSNGIDLRYYGNANSNAGGTITYGDWTTQYTAYPNYLGNTAKYGISSEVVINNYDNSFIPFTSNMIFNSSYNSRNTLLNPYRPIKSLTNGTFTINYAACFEITLDVGSGSYCSVPSGNPQLEVMYGVVFELKQSIDNGATFTTMPFTPSCCGLFQWYFTQTTSCAISQVAPTATTFQTQLSPVNPVNGYDIQYRFYALKPNIPNASFNNNATAHLTNPSFSLKYLGQGDTPY